LDEPHRYPGNIEQTPSLIFRLDIEDNTPSRELIWHKHDEFFDMLESSEFDKDHGQIIQITINHGDKKNR